ncbi:hypothetical protein B9Z45_13205 [Limnohabitans sp. 2KL-17]|uniref:thioesterase II family protein n=1 Tax=Limnohabitans sp. 2KL-17 TaxID=1100704 RepID=UPI000D34AE6D|nr:alpha/beta fold hydrolase [Limnohabitans sp. 2KL-17]PUE53050.1 hypothetical protein B9Z45_13205 [Limnohabitans sp. 2KL-17]
MLSPYRADPWLVGQRQPSASLRLFCFSHAGGHPAAYLAWQELLGPRVEVRAVQLPGRAMRFHERSRRHFGSLCHELVQMIQRHADLPFALFGHSLGALLAFEVARACASGPCTPRHLIVSGCSAPRQQPQGRPLHELDDAALCQELARYHGTPAEVLADRELMQLLLPVVRDDFALVHDYRYRTAARVPLPLTVLAGRDDPAVPAELVPPWAEEAGAGCEVHWFDGGHFFVDSARAAVVDCIRRQLTSLTCPAQPRAPGSWARPLERHE